MGAGMNSLLEIRNYRLRPDSTARFHELMLQASVPLLRTAGMEVVFFGPCAQQDDGYCLIRAYRDLDHLQRSQTEFYQSTAWLNGPRTEILALILSYQNSVIPRPGIFNYPHPMRMK
jgi:hypothetical protein